MITLLGLSPFWMWTLFLVALIIMLWIDLGAFNKKDHVIGIKESLLWTGFWIFLSLLFNLWIYFELGTEIALEYFTGYVIEKSLSMDNLFVFLMIFSAFNIPRIYQHRVLFWGIVGAAVMRGLFIGLGAPIVERFKWVFLIFAAVVLWGAYHMAFQKEKKFDPDKSRTVRIVRKIFPVTSKIKNHNFFVKKKGKLFSRFPFPYHATILFVALITIEVTDVVFATDSIPAIFAITTDPFIVFTSNMFAILGLRALYFAIAGLHAMFVYLKTGLAAILAFIGAKMVMMGVPAAAEALGLRAPWHEIHVPVTVSLTVILGILAISIIASLLVTRDKGKPRRKHPEAGVQKKGGKVKLDITHKGVKKWK